LQVVVVVVVVVDLLACCDSELAFEIMNPVTYLVRTP